MVILPHLAAARTSARDPVVAPMSSTPSSSCGRWDPSKNVSSHTGWTQSKRVVTLPRCARGRLRSHKARFADLHAAYPDCIR